MENERVSECIEGGLARRAWKGWKSSCFTKLLGQTGVFKY